jgi:hypothetical protein
MLLLRSASMSDHEQYIVIEDPENQYYEGSLVEAQKAAQLEARGVITLPVVPDLFKKSAAGGYFKRAWGSGWPLDALHPKMTSQMTLFCDPIHKCLHWKAKLVATDEFMAQPAAQHQGQLQVVADTGQRTPYNASVVPIDRPVLIRELGSPRTDKSWVVGGRATIACNVEGHYGFALYGHAPGLRVLWAAVTVTLEKNKR